MRRKAVALVGATCLVTSLVASSLASAGPAWAEDEGSGSVQTMQPVEPSADPGNQAKPAAAESKAIKDERIALELKFARGEGKSKDTRGHMRSLYQGKWYMPKKEAVRKCIIDRESNFHYKAVSRGGIYRGAYQMNRALAIGVSLYTVDWKGIRAKLLGRTPGPQPPTASIPGSPGSEPGA